MQLKTLRKRYESRDAYVPVYLKRKSPAENDVLQPPSLRLELRHEFAQAGVSNRGVAHLNYALRASVLSHSLCKRVVQMLAEVALETGPTCCHRQAAESIALINNYPGKAVTFLVPGYIELGGNAMIKREDMRATKAPHALPDREFSSIDDVVDAVPQKPEGVYQPGGTTAR